MGRSDALTHALLSKPTSQACTSGYFAIVGLHEASLHDCYAPALRQAPSEVVRQCGTREGNAEVALYLVHALPQHRCFTTNKSLAELFIVVELSPWWGLGVHGGKGIAPASCYGRLRKFVFEQQAWVRARGKHLVIRFWPWSYPNGPGLAYKGAVLGMNEGTIGANSFARIVVRWLHANGSVALPAKAVSQIKLSPQYDPEACSLWPILPVWSPWSCLASEALNQSSVRLCTRDRCFGNGKHTLFRQDLGWIGGISLPYISAPARNDTIESGQSGWRRRPRLVVGAWGRRTTVVRT